MAFFLPAETNETVEAIRGLRDLSYSVEPCDMVGLFEVAGPDCVGIGELTMRQLITLYRQVA